MLNWIRHTPQGKHALFVLIVVCVFMLSITALSLGVLSYSPADWFALIKGDASQSVMATVIYEIRLPRVMLAILIGMLLAVSGAVAQGLFRNPLADPSLIGVSAGASVGASAVIVLGGAGILSGSLVGLVSVGAFLCAALCVALVYRISTTHLGTSVVTLLLAGVAVSAFAASISNLFEYIADSVSLRRISVWQMGGIDSADYFQVMIASVTCLLVLPLAFAQRNALDLFLLGESEARYVGINVKRVKRQMIFLIALAVGVAVSVSGLIAFVGLVVPHIVRLLVGPSYRYVLPFSALLGALLLLLADTLARTMLLPAELPVGLLTSFIGAPLFVWLLMHQQRWSGYVE